MTIGYLISFLLAVGLLVAYCLMVKNKEFWLTMLYICIAIVNLGYTVLSAADRLELAIIGNDIAYLGSAFLSMCMLLTIVRLCGFEVKKWHVILGVSLGVVMFAIVATQGFLPWYYESVKLEMIDGSAKLVKEYGPLHNLYLYYLISYFAAMVATIIYSAKMNKCGNVKFAGFIAGVVFSNMLVWLFEKFINWEFEFLSLTYIASELMLLFIYWMIQDYVHKNDIPHPIAMPKTSVIFVDDKEKAEKINEILEKLPEGITLTARQMDILEGILSGKSRKEIAIDLHLSENTVKMHTTSLFKVLKVSNREEIFSLINT